MKALLYFLFFGFTLVAVANTFAKYQNAQFDRAVEPKDTFEEAMQDEFKLLELRFDALRHKSKVLDKSVNTNEKLYYLTHSDNFEEALFLIDYLTDRFEEYHLANQAYQEVALADLGFYIERLEENLDVVEADLKSFAAEAPRVVER